MLLELHINIPGCNEVSYWTRSGLIVWLNNLKMLSKVLHFSSAFQRECFTLGHSINQIRRGFAGPCSFHHLFRHAVIGWNKKQRGSKVSTSGCFSSFPSQLEMRPVFSCCGQVFAMPGPSLWGSSWLHLHQVCAAFQQLFFYCASSSSSIFSKPSGDRAVDLEHIRSSIQPFGIWWIYPDSTSQPCSPCGHREKETLSWEDRAEMFLSFWETGAG